MYEKFVLYNGNVYTKTRNIFTKKDCFVTRFKEKTDDTFYDYLDQLDRYARDIKKDDIYDMYEIGFYVSYNNGKAAEDDEWWNANENGKYCLPTKIENDEVSIATDNEDHISSGGWEELPDEPGSYAKILNIHDCDKLMVRYTYYVREGKYERKVVEVVMKPEDFKAEMLKHRLINV